MNDEAVYRTAPATPGLLNSVVKYLLFEFAVCWGPPTWQELAREYV